MLYAQPWFWETGSVTCDAPARASSTRRRAARWLAQGEEALEASDREKLERAVRWLWSLLPPDEQTARDERAAKPGLKQ